MVPLHIWKQKQPKDVRLIKSQKWGKKQCNASCLLRRAEKENSKDKVDQYLHTLRSALALNPEESSWKQQSSTGFLCANSPFNMLALAS